MSLLGRALKVFEFDYDFTIDAGAVGTITLRTKEGTLDSGLIVLGGVLDITSACLSGTGTMAINSEGAGDILAATAQAGLTAGRKSIIPVFTGATSVKMTAVRTVQLTITTAVFTAGAFKLTLFCK